MRARKSEPASVSVTARVVRTNSANRDCGLRRQKLKQRGARRGEDVRSKGIFKVQYADKLGAAKAMVRRSSLIHEVGDLYDPIAEDKKIHPSSRNPRSGVCAGRPRSSFRGHYKFGRQRSEARPSSG
jgi:hypothetical protein